MVTPLFLSVALVKVSAFFAVGKGVLLQKAV
jgi:hypothetical protein